MGLGFFIRKGEERKHKKMYEEEFKVFLDKVMDYAGLVFLLSSCLLCFLSQSTLQPNYAASSCSGNNYTSNSIYHTNLKLLLSSLSSNATNTTGFYNTTIGQNSKTVYGLYLCRGDIISQECQNCINMAGADITDRCPNQTVAIIWYDLCMLRYSDQLIFSSLQYDPTWFLLNVKNASASNQYISTLRYTIQGLVRQAAFNSPTRMYATEAVNIPGSDQSLYGLMQCTDDLSRDDCYNCLANATSYLSGYGLDLQQGVRVLLPSCNLRYEIYQFYESITAPPAPSLAPSPPANPSGKRKSSSTIVIIAVILPIMVVILVCVLCVYFIKRRKPKSEIDGLDEISLVQSLQFDFDIIRAATTDFSDLNKLGQGGFGPVYKGKLLDGQEVAVKRLSRYSGQGELEFKNEVVLVAKLQHRNLVRLLGFSIRGEEKLLVYEFCSNTSLDHFIFDPIKRAQLDWEMRHKIIRGIARGLLYLHEDSRLRIIHRDLKASNVLLDKEMNPKISNFGMARLFVVDQAQSTNRIVGTYGYMAPEYARHGFFSVKSDVFSFGVLLLEIVSGRKNNSFYQLEHNEDLLSYAWRIWKEDGALELIDTTMRGNCLISDVTRCIHIGLLCVQDNVADRPTMASVDLMFNSSSIIPPIPSSPPSFYVYNRGEEDKSVSKNDSRVTELATSTNGASITELYPR